jgi:hypothetical protein
MAAPSSPGSASHAGAPRSRGVVDPAAVLRVVLDPFVKAAPPSHWAFEMLQAIFSGDAVMARLLTTSHAKHWNPQVLTEPLGGPMGQNLLHVTALFNRPEIASLLLQSLDRAADEQAE